MVEEIETLTNLQALNFVSIDFETANETRTSACSLGYAIVRSGKIVKSGSCLIKPKELRVSVWNHRVHGISETDLVDALEFDAIWPEIAYLFKDLIVAHNCEFDIDVLNKTAALYNIKLPDFKYLCSYKLAKYAFEDLESHKLKDLSYHFGILLKHHNSHSDAEACARITLKALTSRDYFKFSFDHPELTFYFHKNNTGVSSDKTPFAGKKFDSVLLKPNLDADNKEHPFYNKIVVFTGDLLRISRKDAAYKVQTLGADINTSISKKTQIVIVGDKAGPSKMEKISSLIQSGVSINIMYEEEFLKLLN